MRLLNTTKSAAVLALTALAVGACDEGLTDINKNPNAPEAVPAELLFTSGVTYGVGRALGSTFFWDYSNAWAQHWAKIQYTNEDRYQVRPTTNEAHWQGFYVQSLMDFQRAIAQSDSLDQPNKVGPAMVMRSWNMQIVTDMWGDAPYSQALRGLEAIGGDASVTRPAYDTQRDIYYRMIAQLDSATAILNPAAGDTYGDADLIYGGDPASWRRFSNSLRLRMAMRLSAVDAGKAAAEAVAALAETGGVIDSNSENATLQYGARPSNNPVHENFLTRLDHTISKTLVDSLKALDDPRLEIYAELPEAVVASHTEDELDTFAEREPFYRGQTNGRTAADAPFAQLSMLGEWFLRPETPAPLMTAAEVYFLRAEAAARGFTAENAAEMYEAGIRASLSYYGVPTVTQNEYLAQPRVAFPTAGTWDEQVSAIQLQKWIHLFDNGPEAYAEVRRTDRPLLAVVPQPHSSAGGLFPGGFAYPASEQSVNNENRLAACARPTNSNCLSIQRLLWWDVDRAPDVD
jgi:hypothetical protein